MSIYAYVGLPGSGKSYNVVANVILPALRAGRRVVTNVPVYRDVIMAADGVTGQLVNFPVSEVEQDPELIRKYVTNGDVFVLDEVWKLWPSGLKTADIPNVYKVLLAEHRHMTDAHGRSLHVVLAVQDLGSVAVFARKLVEQTFIHTKMGDLGADGRFRVDIYSGAVTGYMGSDKMFIRSVYGEYVADVWKFYQSHTKAEGVGGGIHGEKSVDRRGNKFKRPFFLYAMPLALLGGVFAVWHLKREGDRMMAHPLPKEVPSAIHPGFVDSVHVPANSGVLGNVVGPIQSRPHFRVLGYIEVPGSPERSKAILVGDSGKTITRSMSHCRFIDRDYFECNVDGEWYGSVGSSLVAHDSGVLPVSIPKDAKFNSPLESGGDAPTSVASGAPAAPPLDSIPQHHLPLRGNEPAGVSAVVRDAHGGS
jgi:zona occludens toxin